MKLDLSNSIDASKAKAYLGKLIELGAKCEIKKILENRNLRQNSYLHVCLGMFCVETGYTIEEAKELFSRQLPEIMRYEKRGENFRRSTTTLDKAEMGKLIDLIREMSLDQLGLYIPTSEEYIQNRFAIERQLEAAGIHI